MIAIATATICAAAIVAESTALANGNMLDAVCIAVVPSVLSVTAIATVVGAAWCCI